jgi:hypothetical protein
MSTGSFERVHDFEREAARGSFGRALCFVVLLVHATVERMKGAFPETFFGDAIKSGRKPNCSSLLTFDRNWFHSLRYSQLA